MEKLKNCPFCKHQPDLVVESVKDIDPIWPTQQIAYIQCGYCGATQSKMNDRYVPLDYCRSEVVRAWNKRARIED